MISVGTAEYSLLRQMERAVNTAFSWAEYDSRFLWNSKWFCKVKHSIVVITFLNCILKCTYREDA